MVSQDIHAQYEKNFSAMGFLKFILLLAIFGLSAWMLADIKNVQDYIVNTCMDGDKDVYDDSSVKHNLGFITIITGVILGISALFLLIIIVGFFWHQKTKSKPE